MRERTKTRSCSLKTMADLSLLIGPRGFFTRQPIGTTRQSSAMNSTCWRRFVGYPSGLTPTARVTIFVGDVNDPPLFVPDCPRRYNPGHRGEKKIYSIDVTKISAIDEDSRFNSEVMYTVAAPEPVRSTVSFKVDSRPGNITIAEKLLQKELGLRHVFIVVRDGGKPTPLYTPIWVNLSVSDSTEPCLLAREPPAPLTGTPDFVQNLSSAPVCEAESIKHPQLTLVAGLGMMLASAWLFVTTAVFVSGAQKRERTAKQE